MFNLLCLGISAAVLAMGLPAYSAEPREQTPAKSGAERDRVLVALFKGSGVSGEGPGMIKSQFATNLGIAISEITPEEIKQGGLKKYHVVIFPGGTGSGQSAALGEEGREAVKTHVREGGGYIGICAGFYLACSGSPSNLGLVDAKTISPKWKRGQGMVGIAITPKGRDVLGSIAEGATIKYQNGPIVMGAGLPELDDFSTWATFATELAENDTPKGIMQNSPAAIAGTYGRGRVVCFSPHPEQTAGMGGLLEKAIRWAASAPPQPPASQPSYNP